MTTALLDRLSTPCGQARGSTGPSVLGQRVHVMDGIGKTGGDGQRVHIQDGTGKTITGRRSQAVHIRGIGDGCPCCPVCVLDDFNRTETGDWGDGWMTFPLGTVGVGSGVAYAENGYAYSTIEGPGPWDAEFTLMTRVRAATTIDSGTSAYWEFQTTDTVTFETRYIAIEFDDAGAGTVTLFTPLGDTSQAIAVDPAGWVYITWHYRPEDVLEAKVWQGTLDDEPGTWTVTRPDDGGPLAANQHDHWAAEDTQGGSERLEIDYIRFISCISDDFERTVSDDWGGSWTRLAGAPGAFSVDGHAGLFNPELSQTPIPDADDGEMLLVRQFAGGIVEFCASFSVRDTTTDNDDESDVFFYLADSVASTPSQRGLEFFVRSDSSTPPFIGPPYVLSLSAVGRGTDHVGDVGDITFDPADFHFGDVYHVHGRIEGGRVLGSIWKDGQSEPDDWQVQDGNEGYTTTLADSFFVGPANVGQTFALHDICAQPDCTTIEG